MRSVPWSTQRDRRRIPPKRARETATVITPAMVIKRFRRSEITVSRPKYLIRPHTAIAPRLRHKDLELHLALLARGPTRRLAGAWRQQFGHRE